MQEREAAKVKRIACAKCGALEKRVRCDACGIALHAADANVWWAMNVATGTPSFVDYKITHMTWACPGWNHVSPPGDVHVWLAFDRALYLCEQSAIDVADHFVAWAQAHGVPGGAVARVALRLWPLFGVKTKQPDDEPGLRPAE